MISTLKKIGSIIFMNAGDHVQYTKSATTSAPDNSQVEAIEFSVPEDGTIRLKYYLYESGSTTFRSAVGRIYLNGSSLFTDITSGEGSPNLNVSRDIDVKAGDVVRLLVSVQNVAQSAYIDAHINNIRICTLETRTINFTIL